MTEETGTSGSDCTGQLNSIPSPEASISHGGVRRSVDTSNTVSGAGKRRRCGSVDDDDVFQLPLRFRRGADVSNVVSDHVVDQAIMCSANDDSISDLKFDEEDVLHLPFRFRRDADVSKVISDHVNDQPVIYSANEGDSISDLKTDFVSDTDTDGFSTSTSTVTVTVTVTKTKTTPETVEATCTSRRKPPPAAVLMPSAAEIEEFFSKAEKFEQKRFVEKYNFDIVKDVPMEGRYQWLPLNP